jgi:hypothetical protein
MTELDRVSRSLGQVRAELTPTPADKVRLRARIIVSPPAASDGGAGSGTGLAALDVTAPRRAVLARGPLSRWVALRATGGLGLALGAFVLGTGVALGFWWGSEQSPRSLERASVAPPVEVALPLAGSAHQGASAGPVPDAEENAPAQQRASAVDVSLQDARAERNRAAAAASRSAPEARAPRPRATPKLERPPGRAPRPPELAPGAGIEHELALLRRVERAIRANEAALALALLAELDEHFPETTLDEERLAARRLAECHAGKPDASSRARRFLVEHATSVYRQRIELACGLGDQSSEPAPMKNSESADTHVR